MFPYAEHRLCVRRMYTNFRTRFRGKEFKDMLWDAARSSHELELKRSLKVIEEKSKEAMDWLNERPTEHWSRACFKTTAQCDILTNNLCECFNRYILDSRDKAIITMLEMIRSKLMRRLYRKRQEFNKLKGPICPKIQKKLDKSLDTVWAYTPLFAGSPQIQVAGPDGQKVVDLTTRQCSCRKWQLTGIPCAHALSCIIGQNEDPINYVNKCYSVQTAKEVYKHVIPGINGPDLWPDASLDAQITPSTPKKLKRGRKQKARKKQAEELEKAAAERNKLRRTGLVKMQCSHCKEYGHTVKRHGKEIQAQYAAKNKRKRAPKQSASATEVTSAAETNKEPVKEKGISIQEPIQQPTAKHPSYKGKGKGKMHLKRQKSNN